MTDSQDTSNSSDRSLPQDWDPFEVGEILDDKYRIVSLLGKGGMGAVYRVTQLLLNVDVALKTLNTQKQNDANSIRRFQTEARAAFSLKHVNLVNIHDFGVLQNNYPFIVMELIEGSTLQQLMQQRGPLPLSDIQSIFVRLCFALSYAHQNGIIHRDIKPGNIMLKRDLPLTDESCVKILDFGLAKIMNSLSVDFESLTKTGDVIGSPLYMSPEQCSGAALDHRTDIYSLGCVLFEALTGTPPHVGANSLRTMMLHQTTIAPSLKEAALGRDFPPGLERIVAKLLAKSPADRYSDLGVVALELSDVCSGKEQTSFQITDQAPAKTASPSNQNLSIPWIQFCALIFGTVFVSTLSGYFLAQRGNPNSNKTPISTVDAKAAQDAEELAAKNRMVTEHDAIHKQIQEANIRSLETFLDAKPIVETRVQVNGKTIRQINFPERVIGKVEYTFHGEGSKKYNETAIGEKYFPDKVDLVYHLNDREHPDVISNPFIFDKINKNIFAGLNYSGSLQGQSFHEEGDENANTELSADEKIGTMHLLKTACQWSKLNDLCLSSVEITKEMADQITSVSTLKRLTLRACKVDPKDLFVAKFTQHLERIDLEQMPTNFVLRQLSGSKNLKVIDIGKGCSAEPSSLAVLQTCPNLAFLYLSMSPMTAEQLHAVLKINSLKTLAISKTALTESQTQEVISHHWSPAPNNLHSPNDPHITFFKVK